MKITVVMAIHRRKEITIETIKRLKQQSKYINGIVLVGDSNVEKDIAVETQCIYLQTKNQPLGRKWQLGVTKARTIKNHGIMICGSDGWISSNWLQKLTPYLREYDLIGKNRAYIYNIDTQELLYRGYRKDRAQYPIGSGRIISRRILDKMNWSIFPVNKKSGMDTFSTKKIIRNNGKIFIYPKEDIFIFGLKGNYETINPFQKTKQSNNMEAFDIPSKILPFIQTKMPNIYESLKQLGKV